MHEQGADFAEVTEGLRLLGVFWERSRYDWSQPGTIRQTVIDSNVLDPRSTSTWELIASPRGEGSEVVMRLSREFPVLPRAVLDARPWDGENGKRGHAMASVTAMRQRCGGW